MNIKHICPGCMENNGGAMTCPHCGFNLNESVKSKQNLMPSDILLGKYLIGKVIKQEGYGIVYIGLDMTLERKVKIHEYLPLAYVLRHDNGYDVFALNDSQKNLFYAGKSKFISIGKGIVNDGRRDDKLKVLDIFEENSTQYIISNYKENSDFSDELRVSVIQLNLKIKELKTIEPKPNIESDKANEHLIKSPVIKENKSETDGTEYNSAEKPIKKDISQKTSIVKTKNKKSVKKASDNKKIKKEKDKLNKTQKKWILICVGAATVIFLVFVVSQLGWFEKNMPQNVETVPHVNSIDTHKFIPEDDHEFISGED